MRTRIATTLAATALALSLGSLTAPTATAATASPALTPVVGSVSVCLNLPLGSAWVSFCI